MSKWRSLARKTIDEVVRSHPPDASPNVLLAAIDKAYPFGERKYHPYKMWLVERGAFIDSQMPRGPGLDRDCPACGRKRGYQCVELQGAGHGRNLAIREIPHDARGGEE